MSATTQQPTGALNRFLNVIESADNKLPHITMLFIWALVITCVLSFALSFVSFDYRRPSTGQIIQVVNILSAQNLLDLMVTSVRNFMNFPPLGITIVATLGIGIAEGSGFINTLLRKLMSYIPRAALRPSVGRCCLFLCCFGRWFHGFLHAVSDRSDHAKLHASCRTNDRSELHG